MSLAPTVRPSALVDYNTASWEQLQAWFCEHNNKITSLNELCTGVAYCHLMADRYPAIISRRWIRSVPASFTERAINWRRLEEAINDVVTKKIDIPERIKPYGRGSLDFCRWFVSFYETSIDPVYLAKRLESRYAKRANKYKNRDPIYEWNYLKKFLDYGINTRGQSEYNGFELYFFKVTADEEELMKKLEADYNKGKTGEEIVQILGAKNDGIITGAMIGVWKAEQTKKYKKDEEAPSMWDYSERCLPKEFIDLNPRQFLVDGRQKNLCFLPTDMLIKICEKLAPSDFLNLSSTCRYLHWRMFTFGKCYAPKTMSMSILCASIESKKTYCGQLKDVYMHNGHLKGIFITKPNVQKPFVFETLELELNFDHYGQAEYDKCLPFILPLRQRCVKLTILFCMPNVRGRIQPDFINYPATNDFFKMIQPYGYRAKRAGRWYCYEDDDTEIYFKCSYARQMRSVRVDFDPRKPARYQLFLSMALENKFGCYHNAPYEILTKSIDGFINGSVDLDFHAYFYERHCWYIDWNEDEEEDARWERLSLQIRVFLFSYFLDLEEFYSSKYQYVWMGKLTSNRTRPCLQVKIIQNPDDYPDIAVLIGKEEIFDEMEDRSKAFLRVDHLINHQSMDDQEKLWKMETAMEPEEGSEEMTGREWENGGETKNVKRRKKKQLLLEDSYQ